MPDDAAVRLPPLAGRQQESWRAFIELAPTLGDHCLLVGGQMVFLLEVERGSRDTRPTDDVDIVIDLRVEPAGLVRVHQTLIDAGFGQVLPSTDGIAHRYTRSGATIDVLAPDRLGSRARRLASSHRLMRLRGEGDAGTSRPRRTRGSTRPSCFTCGLGAGCARYHRSMTLSLCRSDPHSPAPM